MIELKIWVTTSCIAAEKHPPEEDDGLFFPLSIILCFTANRFDAAASCGMPIGEDVARLTVKNDDVKVRP